MDASPMQSGSKCGGSDFSIERILAGKKDIREETEEVPEWLCCTRYRPPRLPRAASVCRVRRAGRHARVPFTAAQAAALEAAYARAPYLAPPALKALAAALQLRDDRIKIWFQNRRARERREKSTNIAPPQGITLAPTTLASGFPMNTWAQANLGITRNAQAFITHRFNEPGNFVASAKINPDLSFSQFKTHRSVVPRDGVERLDEHRSISNYDSRDVEDRPGTPLDIETVDD